MNPANSTSSDIPKVPSVMTRNQSHTDQSHTVPVELGDVQETLLIPLYYRAIETHRPDGLIRDDYAIQVLEKLDYDFHKFAPHWNIQMDVVVRTEIFDEITREFLTAHPDGLVLNLGAGLDARYLRMDNQTITWIDVDLPDAIALRKQFFPDTSRHLSIAANIFDWSWLDRVPVSSPSGVLVLAEGLFCYCEEAQIKELLERISQRWPGTLLAFQSLCPALVGAEKAVGAVNQTKAKFRWGIRSGKQVAKWNPKYRFLKDLHFVDRHRARWESIGRRLWIPWTRRWFRQVMKVTVLKLG